MARRTRSLRTNLPDNPQTQGERIRYARISSNMTQQGLAAAVSKVTHGLVDKGTVSKWEGDSTANPTNANILAIQAVTGFSVQWLVHGRGEMRVSSVAQGAIDAAVLTRAMRAVRPDAQEHEIAAVATLYDLVIDAPGLSETALQRTATALLERPAT